LYGKNKTKNTIVWKFCSTDLLFYYLMLANVGNPYQLKCDYCYYLGGVLVKTCNKITLYNIFFRKKNTRKYLREKLKPP